MTATEESTDERIDRLHADGIVDMHFDLPMDLYEKRDRKNLLETECLPELETGNMGVLGAAITSRTGICPPRDGLAVASRKQVCA